MTRYTRATIIVSAFVALTFAGNASAQKTVFKPVDTSLETQVCYTAAKEGRRAALDLVNAKGLNASFFEAQLTCNGRTLAGFARKFEVQNDFSKTEDAIAVKLITRTNDSASRICLDAIAIGYRATVKKYNIANEVISCNNMSLRNFVNTYKDAEVVDNTAE